MQKYFGQYLFEVLSGYILSPPKMSKPLISDYVGGLTKHMANLFNVVKSNWILSNIGKCTFQRGWTDKYKWENQL